MALLVLRNFRLVDETMDAPGSVIAEDGLIKEVYTDTGDGFEFIMAEKEIERAACRADTVLNGGGPEQTGSLVLMPAFVDLHAHFREGAPPTESAPPTEARLPSEALESACLAAAAGGYGTVVCMANTAPVTDTIAGARSVKNRTDALGIVDVYPVLSLSKGMEGKELSEITLLPGKQDGPPYAQLDHHNGIRLLSEDGRDIAGDVLFLAALEEACRSGLPVSCHCDLGGENNAVRRALELGEKTRRTQRRLHIAHVSTKEAAALIREAKKTNPRLNSSLSCEVTPHHIALTEEDAAALGAESHGKVAPPLRTEADKQALIAAIADGTVDAIATDHAPHSRADKERGAPGFSGLETAFAVCHSTLVQQGHISLSKLSSLMSAAPARILGLGFNGGNCQDKGNCYGRGHGHGHGYGRRDRRGRIAPGLRADLVIADLTAQWTVDPAAFLSRGKNSPFTGKELTGRIVKTIRGGCIVFDG